MSTSTHRPYRGRRPGPVTDPVHQLLSRAAHWHADNGLFVFPLAPGRKVPAVDKDWEAAATTDHRTITRLWRQAPFNIGVATGRSGLLVAVVGGLRRSVGTSRCWNAESKRRCI